ncbi:MAG TPA: NrtA/SsuA/CpmA family ABC transporter substrate-binding protein [Candidatus Binatia bacterium]|jgi:ABC-type nitrate/sulfonate/bicarbonate transport system substrate-binding protein
MAKTTALLALVALTLASPASGQMVKLQSAYSTIAVGQSLIWVTKEAGLFKENGLDVQLLFIGSSTTVTQAVIAGDVPIVIMSGATAINSALSGSDLVMLASTKRDPAQAFLVVSKEITGAAQLKGKKLGVSRLGASSDFLLRYLLKKIGLAPEKDVSIVQVGSSPVRMAALANGAIDGTALTFEEMLVAKKLGFNILLDITTLGIEGLNSDIVATRKFVRDSRDTVRKFVKGMVKGASFYSRNKKFSMEVIEKYTRSKDMEKIENGYDYNAKVYLKKPYPAMQGIQLALEEIGERNAAAKSAKPEQFIDVSFVKELDESGYIDSLYK